MSKTYNEKKHWFTAADVLITIIVLALVAGAVVLFLFPDNTESSAETVQASIQLLLPEKPIGIVKGDKLFYNDAEIGKVSRIDDSRVTVQVSIQTDDGVYLLGGEPVRINGDFVLETRLRRVTGVIESIIQEGGAA